MTKPHLSSLSLSLSLVEERVACRIEGIRLLFVEVCGPESFPRQEPGLTVLFPHVWHCRTSEKLSDLRFVKSG